jgi:hypothetical protein
MSFEQPTNENEGAIEKSEAFYDSMHDFGDMVEKRVTDYGFLPPPFREKDFWQGL